MSDLGVAPILDFDGTIAALDVDWHSLRLALGIDRIGDLWADESNAPTWLAITEAETQAAYRADPILSVTSLLGGTRGFAILTDNSEDAVSVFLGRHIGLAVKCRAVIGRETLGGPKRSPGIFGRGLHLAAEATAKDRGDAPIVYVGNEPWECDLAQGLGVVAILVAS